LLYIWKDKNAAENKYEVQCGSGIFHDRFYYSRSCCNSGWSDNIDYLIGAGFNYGASAGIAGFGHNRPFSVKS
jgi:hypothetical protein